MYPLNRLSDKEGNIFAASFSRHPYSYGDGSLRVTASFDGSICEGASLLLLQSAVQPIALVCVDQIVLVPVIDHVV